MTYTKTTWVDDVTPISAANLNKIEARLEATLAKDGSEAMTGDLNVNDVGNATLRYIRARRLMGADQLELELFVQSIAGPGQSVTLQRKKNGVVDGLFRIIGSKNITIDDETIWHSGNMVWDGEKLTIGGKAVGGVKNVQRGIADVTTTTNVTISSVDMAKSYVIVSSTGKESGLGDAAVALIVRARLTSATNLELFQNLGGTAKVAWEVVENY